MFKAFKVRLFSIRVTKNKKSSAIAMKINIEETKSFIDASKMIKTKKVSALYKSQNCVCDDPLCSMGHAQSVQYRQSANKNN